MSRQNINPVLGLLKEGAILRYGDEYQDPHTGKWHGTTCAGKPVGIEGMTSLKYRRKLQAEIIPPKSIIRKKERSS